MASKHIENAIVVELAYATPEHQWLLSIKVPAGTTVEQAIELSNIAQYIPGFDIEQSTVGIFSKQVSWDYTLNDGDRIEMYRPLFIDPMQARRRREKI